MPRCPPRQPLASFAAVLEHLWLGSLQKLIDALETGRSKTRCVWRGSSCCVHPRQKAEGQESKGKGWAITNALLRRERQCSSRLCPHDHTACWRSPLLSSQGRKTSAWVLEMAVVCRLLHGKRSRDFSTSLSLGPLASLGETELCLSRWKAYLQENEYWVILKTKHPSCSSWRSMKEGQGRPHLVTRYISLAFVSGGNLKANSAMKAALWKGLQRLSFSAPCSPWALSSSISFWRRKRSY